MGLINELPTAMLLPLWQLELPAVLQYGHSLLAVAVRRCGPTHDDLSTPRRSVRRALESRALALGSVLKNLRRTGQVSQQAVCWALLGLLFLSVVNATAARADTPTTLEQYLPAGETYDATVPAPDSVLGFGVGEWHVRHDMLVRYYEVLAKASPRLQLTTYGRTHEGRALILASVSSPRNLRRLERLRQSHLDAYAKSARGEWPTEGSVDAERPVVVWMGYSVHGNESSGANASMLLAYHLAAARGEKIDRLLEETIILIDPCLNPDGLGRFAQWANSHRGKTLVADGAHREHVEVWPGGRTNHYWFDLNRDWLLLTHPESRARLEQYHRWKPNVVTDFHEMGTDQTYFFQPGVPTRQNPRTPPRNFELTSRIAAFHARALDKAGSLYYTEESFDDFYYGKGSTYPDVNGAIGILFEQASSRGHLQKNSFGLLSFPFTIKNQFLTSLSTLDAAHSMRRDLLRYQAEFYAEVDDAASRDPVRAYVFGSPHDPARNAECIDILLRHQIEVRRLATPVVVGDRTFAPADAYIVRVRQPQYRLLQSLFERRTEFPDTTFYDVSTWTLPLAFGLPYAALDVSLVSEALFGDVVEAAPFDAGAVEAPRVPYAYAFDWSPYYAPRAAQRLLRHGVRLRVATRPFRTQLGKDRERQFHPGTVIVPMGIQAVDTKEIRLLMKTIATDDYVDVVGLQTGLTTEGIDLGSPNVLEMRAPKPCLVVGSGVSGYEAGEVWHLLDQRVDLELTMVERSRFASVDLAEYTHLVLVSGRYDWSGEALERLRDWLDAGGVLIAVRGAIPWVESAVLERTDESRGASADEGRRTDGDKADDAAAPDTPAVRQLSYAEYDKARAEALISGTIFEATIDGSHPLGFGYLEPTLPVFRSSTIFLESEKDPVANVVEYTESPLLSGYVSEANLKRLAGTPVVCATRFGLGTVVRIVDNPNFRGVWYGTNKLFLNALYFGHVIKRTAPLEAPR